MIHAEDQAVRGRGDGREFTVARSKAGPPRKRLCFSEIHLMGITGSGYKHNSGAPLPGFKSQFWYVFAV